MKYKKFNKYEKKEVRRQMIQEAMSGGGVYVYKNSSPHAELTLPRPTASGVRKVGPAGEFQGDDYYMQMVRTGDLRLVKVIQTAQQEEEARLEAARAEEELVESTQVLNESVKGGVMSEQKLITEQPITVTTKGAVEHVVVDPNKKQPKKTVRESTRPQPQQDMLLNEDSDGFLIVG